MTSETPQPPSGPGDDGNGAGGEEAPAPLTHPALDTTIAHQARMYDYWLGGKDNFEADRKAGDAMTAIYPDAVHAARANRAFLGRVVRYLAGEAGIRQFLDIGTGIPSPGNTHEVAQAIAPDAKVVYVDYDPVVLSYAYALLKSGPQGSVDYIDADLRDTATVLERAARTLDFTQPVAVSLLAILHAIPDADDPHGIVGAIMDALPPGSHLAISHGASDIEPETAAKGTGRINQLSHQQFTGRSHAEVMRFFGDLEIAEPGLVQVHQWRPDAQTETGRAILLWGGVGRKVQPGPVAASSTTAV